MLRHHEGIGQRAVEHSQRAVEDDVVVVGRIKKDEACLPEVGGGAFEPADDVTTHDVGPLLQLEGVQVLAQDSKTARLPVDERDLGGAARKSLDADRSRTREKVEDMGAFDARADEVEDRGLDDALRRPDPLRRFQATTASLSATTTPASPTFT